MARIAYVDHSFHERTRSTLFLPELLRARGHDVDMFWDEAWAGGAPIQWSEVCDRDVVIMFQSYCPTEGLTFRSLHSNVVYIPMVDQFGLAHGPVDLRSFWQVFEGSKVLSFSSALHALATAAGIASRFVRYYPEPPRAPPHTGQGLRGFFWLRRERELGWDVIRTIIGSTTFDTFHLHVAGDPGFPPVQAPRIEDVRAHHVTLSTWFGRRSDFEEVVRQANVFFAPRLAEGIGQSFLEAMACGQCVVAPDGPTMNEYVVHGVNGLLYDPHLPARLDFSDARRMGRRARDGAIAGRTRWRSSEQAVVDFILTPSADLYGDRADITSNSTAFGREQGRGRVRAYAARLRRRL